MIISYKISVITKILSQAADAKAIQLTLLTMEFAMNRILCHMVEDFYHPIRGRHS